MSTTGHGCAGHSKRAGGRLAGVSCGGLTSCVAFLFSRIERPGWAH